MSARVDVREVMDSVIARSGHVVASDVVEARAAVAELIEAADRALSAFDGEEDSVKEEHADTIRKLRAALAGVRP